MAITISGTDGIVGAGFTVDASGVSVTAGVGTFSSLNAAASGLTGALPAISGANLTNLPAANLTGTLPAISGANLTNVGITMAEIWRVNTEYTTNSGNTVYPTNWERDDNNLSGHVGSSGMSESSGVFTFPSTGIYQVTWQGYGRAAQDSGNTLVANGIYSTANNSSYSVASIMYYTCPNLTTYNYAWGEVKAIIDVTDTSNVKVKLSNYSANFMTWEVNSNYNLNCATFLRLGDT